ncbi:MAG: VWA domain-containing protein [Glaciecola sp.]
MTQQHRLLNTQKNLASINQTRPYPLRFKRSVLVAATSAAIVFLSACAAPEDKSTQQIQEKEQAAKAEQTARAHEQKQKALRTETNRTRDIASIMRTPPQQEQAFQKMVSRPMPPEFDKDVQWQATPSNGEKYESPEINEVKISALEPVSTFSIDVDTGSYTNTRRMLNQGYLPPADAVRIEEFINYFDYQYEAPQTIDTPFSVNTAVSEAPWDSERHILRIALKGYQAEQSESKGSNLVFLLDVSGSMNQTNKLPLLKRSLTMLSNQLNSKDKVSIVVYAGASGVVLEPTDGNNKLAIQQALDKLSAGGSTNGAAGIQQAYQLAEKAFIKGGVNRVILATDGDFNVGTVNHDALLNLIKQKKQKGIALTTLGFGQGNYNDHLMEQLADAGNGNYAYIDTINEARKVLVDELQSTMQMIAKDVKIQVEFNPDNVAEYRLIGYENRQLANEDFNNDKVDAGDIGAGHKVTALYEITLSDSKNKFNDERRYTSSESSQKQATESDNTADELAYVKLRYKPTDSDTSQLIDTIVKKQDIKTFAQQSDDFKFASAVASFAQRLKNSKYAANIDYQWITQTALQTKGKDEFGYRSEFIQLVRNAEQLSARDVVSADSERLSQMRK